MKYRLLMPDGSVKYVHAVAHAVRDASGNIEFVVQLLTLRPPKETERKLRRKRCLFGRIRSVCVVQASWGLDVRRRDGHIGRPEIYGLFGFDPERAMSAASVPGSHSSRRQAPNVEAAARAIREKADFEVDFRIVLPDGSDQAHTFRRHAVVGSDGDVVELVRHQWMSRQYAAKVGAAKGI